MIQSYNKPMLIIICSPVALLLQLQRNEDCMQVFYITCTHSIPVHTQLDSPTPTSHPGGNVQTHMHKDIILCRCLCMYTMKSWQTGRWVDDDSCRVVYSTPSPQHAQCATPHTYPRHVNTISHHITSYINFACLLIIANCNSWDW